MEILKRLASGNISQRRNALDVISEILNISSESQKLLPYSAWYDCSYSHIVIPYFLVVCLFNCWYVYFRQDIANKLLELLGDEEILIREQTSKLLPLIG